MKKLLLISLTLSCACTPTDQKEESVSIDSVLHEEQKENIAKAESDILIKEEKKSSLLSFFPKYQSDSLTVEVEVSGGIGLVKEEDCIPSTYQKYFDGLLYPTSSTSTGSKPLGRLKIGEDKYLLTLLQLDDYGPVYYGLTYDENADKIVSKEVIAQEWSDAGDTQLIHSSIIYKDGQLQVSKKIKTCHADMDTMGINTEETEIECNDSTATVVVNKQLDFEKIK